VIIKFLWKIFHKPIVLVVLTTANFRGFSNFCRYYTRSQTGKSTGYRPTLKPLQNITIIYERNTCQVRLKYT
jgi:hypothetical protein